MKYFQVNAQAGCTLFTHDCDNWNFIIKVNKACMDYHGVDVTEWRVNTVDVASVTDPSCKFDPTLVNGEYTLEFAVDACGNAESMSNDHKIWTAIIDNKDTNAGIYTSQKISQPFSCKYNKGLVQNLNPQVNEYIKVTWWYQTRWLYLLLSSMLAREFLFLMNRTNSENSI